MAGHQGTDGASRASLRRNAKRAERTRRTARTALALVIAGTLAGFGVVPAAIAEVGTPTPTPSSSETVAEPTPSQPAPEPSATAPEQSEVGEAEPSDSATTANPAGPPAATEPDLNMAGRSMSLMLGDPTVAPLAVGPEPGFSGPYLYWELRTANNDNAPLVGGASFELQGPRAGGATANWNTTRSVQDCVSTPCPQGSLDRDPDPGEFQVVNSVSGFTIASSQRWRVRPNGSPTSWSYAGVTYAFTSSTTTWVEIAGTSSTSNTPANGQWVTTGGVTSHDFGNFVANAVPTTQAIVVRKRVLAEPSAVGGTVTGNIGTNYSYTEGAVFRLYENTNNAPGAATQYTCTVPAGTGECTITVPDVNNGGANYNKRYWVVEEAPVAGSPAANTYSNPTLYVGDFGGPAEVRRLVGLTKPVSATAAQYLPMVNAGVTGGTVLASGELPGPNAPNVARGASFGAAVNSYQNPDIIPKCEAAPLRIAIVLDQSASITATQWTTFRNALVSGSDSVLGILRDAGSMVSILGFGTGVTSPNGWHHGASGPAPLPANLTGLIPTTRPGGNENRTNWDAALSTIASANATHKYDLVMFVTDGAPNYILAGTGVDGNDVALRSLEAPIYAANALKVAGVRVAAVGVGNGATGPGAAANLRAVSGKTPDSDYIQGDWDKLKDILTDIVKVATCTLPVEVSKTTVAANGTTTTLAGGWEFTATKTAEAGSTLSPAGPQTTASGALGTARWDLAFDEPSGLETSLTIQETSQPGWSLTAVNCTVGGAVVQVTISNGSVTFNDLTALSGRVACEFVNTEAQFGNLAVTKAFGTPMPPGPGPAGVTFTGAYSCTIGAQVVASGTWSLTGTGAATLTPTSAGTSGTTQQVPAGASCEVTEVPPTPGDGMPDPSWIWDTASVGAPVTIVNGQTATVTVTNQAKRVYGNFQVTKDVPAGSTADAGNEYSGGWSCVLGAEPAVTGTWGPIVEGAVWSSTNANLIPLGATCSVTSETRPDWPVAADHSIQWDGAADLGTAVLTTETALNTITVTNVTKQVLGTVSWTKVDATTAALLAGSAWKLTGPGVVDVIVIDCTTASCPTDPNTDQDAAAGAFRIVNLAWGDYTVTETTAPPGYLIDPTPHSFTVGENGVEIDLGAIDNQLVTPPTIPLTGGISRDAYLIAGSGALLIALAASGVMYFRSRRKQV